jgi:plastocyanin
LIFHSDEIVGTTSTVAAFLRVTDDSFSNSSWQVLVKKETTMKTTKLIAAMAVSAGLAFGVAAQAKEKKHEEETVSSSDVPAAVQKAAETQAKGGTIVRWEKEGANYEAVIDKNGKQWGVEFDENGKVLKKHDESKEHKEKGEKY